MLFSKTPFDPLSDPVGKAFATGPDGIRMEFTFFVRFYNKPGKMLDNEVVKSSSHVWYVSHNLIGLYILIDTYSRISQLLPSLLLLALNSTPFHFPYSSNKLWPGDRNAVDLFPTSRFSSTLSFITNELNSGQ